MLQKWVTKWYLSHNSYSCHKMGWWIKLLFILMLIAYSAAHKEGSKIPLTVITGFLGAGKTTLLNSIPNSKMTPYFILILIIYLE